MRFYKIIVYVFLFLCCFQIPKDVESSNINAKWITEPYTQNETNTWLCFRKDFLINDLPDVVIARIAVDSKYWLWINGKLVVFEGGLKRGPNPRDTYYDEVNITNYLNKGKNSVSILTWFFGKDGFSHISSGKTGLLFECKAKDIDICSDNSWKVKKHESYGSCSFPYPNFRLSESSIRFDARLDFGTWQAKDYSVNRWSNVVEIDTCLVEPWNNLVLRPIPQWKNSGLLKYINTSNFPIIAQSDTIITCILPANIQITPFLQVESKEGLVIDIRTDNYFGGGSPNLRAEYITRTGIQKYESYGWLNGHKVLYTIPKGVKILDLKYRETGYNTEFAGNFLCSDEFLNKLWKKSQRTLYVTMRDNYMDCPDRERAQWWGDVVIEGGEAFYALCPQSHMLLKKGMYELIGWQRENGVLYSPIPSGNWNKELPGQMLSSIGYYGFWNYYMHTGDLQTVKELYPGVKKYLNLWKINEKGTVYIRTGTWTWGDWGKEKDIELIYNALFYMAIKGAANMAKALNLLSEEEQYLRIMNDLKSSFNKNYWNGNRYRSSNYKGKTDDRSQTLAVVSGIADKDKFPAILEILKNEEHASPYMEKYVLEALFQMGYEDYAIQRMKKRYATMVNNNEYTTLFEGWGIGEKGFGGGTINHAWSGGCLTILSQYLCGIEPINPGYDLFQVMPQPGLIKKASATILSVKGEIVSSFINNEDLFELNVDVPADTKAIVGIPKRDFKNIEINRIKYWQNGEVIFKSKGIEYLGEFQDYIKFKVNSGSWKFISN